jgi:hypothetical protein
MRKLLCMSLMVCGFTLAAIGQTSSGCPANFVCISPAAARQALEDGDVRKAQEIQILDLKKAILDEKSITLDVKIELAKTTGQLTGVQGENVTLRALVDMLVKNTRKKSIGFIAF